MVAGGEPVPIVVLPYGDGSRRQGTCRTNERTRPCRSIGRALIPGNRRCTVVDADRPAEHDVDQERCRHRPVGRSVSNTGVSDAVRRHRPQAGNV